MSHLLRADGGNVIEVPYECHELDELVHAYAVPVHKSKGSEFPAVMLPLTIAHYLLLQQPGLHGHHVRGGCAS